MLKESLFDSRGEACTVQLADARDIADVAELVSRVFLEREPMSSSYERDYDVMYRCCEKLTALGIKVRCAWVTKDVIDEKPVIVAALLAADYVSLEESVPLEGIDRDIVKVLDRCAKLYEASHGSDHGPQRGECLHLVMLAVDKCASSRGLGKTLVSHALERGRQLGYRTAVAECTNVVSQNIFEHSLKFRRIGIVPYTDFPEFQSIVAKHTGAIVLEKYLSQ